jgi:selenocysteine-specific elongation factor
VRLHLPVALPLAPGDRYVLRESGRGETVGGGEILDVAPVLPASKARPDRRVARVVAERGAVDVDELERLTGSRHAPTHGRWVVDAAEAAAAVSRLRAAVDGAGALGLDVASLGDVDRAVLDSLADVDVVAGRARLAGGTDAFSAHPFLAALEAAPFQPPTPDAERVDRAELRELVRRGLVVEQDGQWFAPAAIDRLAAIVGELLAAEPGGVTVGAVRDATGSTRKHVLPLLNALDARGITRRRGDLRVAGPRLPGAPTP